MAVLPTGSEFFSILPVARGGIGGGVTIFVAAVVSAPAVSVSFLLSLSSSSCRYRCQMACSVDGGVIGRR